ncbi:hypothetical protein [Thalassotalea sediminis]|uniref:hypothetical protein n=1 Tax=Thalassotalea sediminis TaxID=1759089 RepID=UPI002572E7C0|nr:hypothetical protein [Thalassotalea sediminis]
MFNKVSLFIIMLLASTNIFAQNAGSMDLPKQPKTYRHQSSSEIALNVFVDAQGQALEVKLANPKQYNTFSEFALLRAKKLTYPIKLVKGKPVKYWLKDYKISYSVESKSSTK